MSFSARALERVRARKSPAQSWYLDVALLAGYYQGEKRVYHHTAPISAIYALHAGLALVEEEGMQAREARHREAASTLVSGVEPLGFTPLVEAEHRLPMLTSLLLPDDVVARDEGALRARLLEHHGIEVGAGLGSLAGKIWRVGLMGENARVENVERLVSALRGELERT